jgi:hypothetical protein
MPGLVRSAHDEHFSVHAELQQTPSTQNPLAHSLAFEHFWNSPMVGLGPASGAGPSAIPRSKGVESTGVESIVAIAESVAESTIDPSDASLVASPGPASGAAEHVDVAESHTPERQSAPVAQLVLQAPAAPQRANGLQLRAPCGAVSVAIALHVPALPATSQAKHELVQSLLQQVPSTHRPLTHWPPVVQAEPFPFLATHVPVARSQLRPVAHSMSFVQVVAQVPAEQAYGAAHAAFVPRGGPSTFTHVPNDDDSAQL